MLVVCWFFGSRIFDGTIKGALVVVGPNCSTIISGSIAVNKLETWAFQENVI